MAVLLGDCPVLHGPILHRPAISILLFLTICLRFLMEDYQSALGAL